MVVIVFAMSNAVSFLWGVVMRFLTLWTKEDKLVVLFSAFIGWYILSHPHTPYIPPHLGP
jgi:hypothetical protein